METTGSLLLSSEECALTPRVTRCCTCRDDIDVSTSHHTDSVDEEIREKISRPRTGHFDGLGPRYSFYAYYYSQIDRCRGGLSASEIPSVTYSAYLLILTES